MLCYVFALLHNALTLLRSAFASLIYHSGHIGAMIASHSYFSKLIDQRYCFNSLSLFHYYVPAFHFFKFFEERTRGISKIFLQNPWGYPNFFLQNSLFILFICTLKTRFSIKNCWHLALQSNSDNVTLHIALLHNALEWWRKVITSKSLCF